MSGYSCSDCEKGELIVQAREIKLEDGEIASVLGSGVIIATKIACSNKECSSHADADAEDEEETGDLCGHNGCARPKGHDGNHRKPNKKKD